MSERIYALNVNPDEVDVIHLRPANEACNQDDAKQRTAIDPDTADALVNLGEARRCERCFPNEGDTP